MNNLLKKIFNKETFIEVFKYGIVTLISYFFLVGSIYLFENIFGWDEKFSYAIALTINYVGVYIGYNKFVFKTTHNMGMLKRFVIVLILSWIANNLFFALWLDVFSIHYTIAVILNTVFLGGFRFIAQKFYVRK
ncbi:MAG: hypothetical protein R3B65_01125 [Candidatus Paceibacterota bacterium]